METKSNETLDNLKVVEGINAKAMAFQKVQVLNYTEYWKLKLRKDPSIAGEEYSKDMEELEKLKEEAESKTMASGKGSYGCLLTINPKPEVTLIEFKKIIDKLLQKKWLVDYIYCYETRKPDNSGMHFHMAFKRGDKRPSEIKREVLNTCKNIIGNELHLNYQFCSAKGYINFENYCKGFKNGKKKKNSEHDSRWRTENGLKDWYVSDPDDNLSEDEE